MTVTEIIKGLEKELHHADYHDLDYEDNVPVALLNSAYNLIKRQQIEIERNNKRQYMLNNKCDIKIKKTSPTAIIPQRQSIGSAGYDLYVDINEPIEIKPHETVMLQSGIAFEIPKGYFGAIYARSGLSTKQGIRPATCVSVIDSDYRGTVGVPLHNDTNETKIIQPGERVAQIVFQKALDVELVLVDKLSETERGNNGFGSTGR